MSASNVGLPWITQDSRRIRIAVVGDIILDEYLEGFVSRISPEAPVPVHVVTGSHLTAGGASNVARNIQLAGGQACLLGVWGKDQSAEDLKKILESDGIDVSQVIAAADRPTIKKTRVTSNNHQLIRVDWEKVHPVSADQQDAMLKALENARADVILVSDYGKGSLPPEFIRRVLSISAKKNIPTIIDPKGRDYSRYEGAYLITPNRKEACEALGLDPQEAKSPKEMARALQQQFKLKNVLITLGSEGMYLQPENLKEKPTHMAAQAREVYDVSGAGDTVVAVMALAIGAKASFTEAMRIANAAAGKVVEKWGTQPITRTELEEALASDHTVPNFSSTSKIVDLPTLKTLVGSVQIRKRKVVFTNGCFDLLHAGHVTYLEEARGRGDLLVIGVNTDASVRRLKGPARPVNRCEDRMRVLAALGCVDYVISFDADTPADLIKEIVPNVLLKGADWTTDNIVGADIVKANGGKVENVPLVPGLSSTELMNRIKSDKGVNVD